MRVCYCCKIGNRALRDRCTLVVQLRPAYAVHWQMLALLHSNQVLVLGNGPTVCVGAAVSFKGGARVFALGPLARVVSLCREAKKRPCLILFA